MYTKNDVGSKTFEEATRGVCEEEGQGWCSNHLFAHEHITCVFGDERDVQDML